MNHLRPSAAAAALLFSVRHALLASALALISATSVSAMSYLPMTDESLLATSDVVVSGKIVEVRGAAGRELDETSYRLQQGEVLKGTVEPGDLDIRLPGAFDQSANGALIIPGMPRFSADEPVLLFLKRRADGSYSPNQLLLGVFRIRKDVAGDDILIQDLAQAEEISSPGNPPGNGRFRNAERFASWIRDRAHGNPHDDPYWSNARPTPGGKYQLSSPAARWFHFQDNLSVPIYANDRGENPSDIENLQAAIDAWNSDSGSTVSLVYSGISTKASGLQIADGVNQVLFDDPNNELLGSFDCLLGGIGAYGQWRSYETRTFNGDRYGVIYEGDIVVQDGVSCIFSGDRGVNAAELIAHELGHLLGLGHSCGGGLLATCTPGTAEDDALMRPTLHADGRGPSLGADDISGLSKLYSPIPETDGSSNPGTSAEAEPGSGGGSFDLNGLGLLLLAFLAALARCASIDRSVEKLSRKASGRHLMRICLPVG